jgi:predicted transcriptional regulator
VSTNKIYAAITYEGRLSSSQRTVLTYLCHCWNHKTGRCDPAVKTIAKACTLAVHTVEDALAALKRKNLITAQNRFSTSNAYDILITYEKGKCRKIVT